MYATTTTMKRITVACVSVLLLAGCSSTPAPRSIQRPTIKPTTYYGETAIAVANQVKACGDIKAGDIGKGGPDMASTATCTLNGRTITINSWATVEARDSVNGVIQANKQEAYYAQGEGWTATPTDSLMLQHQLTNDAAALIADSLTGETPPAPDIVGQQASAKAVTESLGGEVVHVQP